MAYLNLLNSRNGKGENSEILRSYIKERNRGILIGSVFFSLSSLVLTSLIIKGFFLDYQKRLYLNDVFTYDKTVLKIQKINEENKKVEKENKNIIDTILALRSNVNILNELKEIIPRDLYLDSLKISDDEVIFKGSVKNNLGIKIINAFMLEIIESPLFVAESLKLKDIKYQDSTDAFEFSIGTKFVKNMSHLNFENINNQNNKGLYQKLLIMQKIKLLEKKNNSPLKQ